MPITREEKAAYEARRQRVTERLLDAVTDPTISQDLWHYAILGSAMTNKVVDRITDCVPRGAKDRDGLREAYLSVAIEAIRRCVDVEPLQLVRKG